MIGLIHRMLFDMLASSAGTATVAEVRRRAGVPEDKYFSISEVYDDAEWQRLFQAACEVLHATPEQGETAFADYFLADAAIRWPVWFQSITGARGIIERQPVIHNSLATGVQDPVARKAVGDKFRVERRENELVTYYRSANQHCGLYKALVRGLLAHYGESATVDESQCMKHGAAECVIHTRWTSQENPA